MKLGIMVDALGMSQMSYVLINEINKMNSFKEHIDTIVFYHRYDRLLQSPHFAMLQEQQAWGYDAAVISTDLITTARLINCPRPNRKLFYIWNLEWLYASHYYNTLADVYLHPDIELIARNKHHERIISSCWKKPVATIEDFNHEQIIELIKTKV